MIRAPISSGIGADARPLQAVLATPNFFPMLGVKPAIGRFFDASEERDENGHVAVLGYDEWRGKFGGDAGVLGRTIDVAGVPHTIVGVAPEGFTGDRPQSRRPVAPDRRRVAIRRPRHRQSVSRRLLAQDPREAKNLGPRRAGGERRHNGVSRDVEGRATIR